MATTPSPSPTPSSDASRRPIIQGSQPRISTTLRILCPRAGAAHTLCMVANPFVDDTATGTGTGTDWHRYIYRKFIYLNL